MRSNLRIASFKSKYFLSLLVAGPSKNSKELEELELVGTPGSLESSIESKEKELVGK